MQYETEEQRAAATLERLRREIGLVSASDLRPVERRWDIPGAIAGGDVCFIGGPSKSLKTSIACDLAVSQATGAAFLGRYPVPNPHGVLFFSGESDLVTLRETVATVAAAKGVEYPRNLHLVAAVPKLEMVKGFKRPLPKGSTVRENPTGEGFIAEWKDAAGKKRVARMEFGPHQIHWGDYAAWRQAKDKCESMHNAKRVALKDGSAGWERSRYEGNPPAGSDAYIGVGGSTLWLHRPLKNDEGGWRIQDREGELCPVVGERMLHNVTYELSQPGLDVMTVIIDPLYLAVGGDAVNSADLSAMGSRLRALIDAAKSNGQTVAVVHHATKALAPGQPMALNDLAGAGVSEYMRQWILVNRRRAFDPRSGDTVHRLWATIGGSAGHTSCVAVNIDAGKWEGDASERRWSVEVMSAEEAKAADATATTGQRRRKKDRTQGERRRRLLAALPIDGAPISMQQLSAETGMSHTTLTGVIEASPESVVSSMVGRSRQVRLVMADNGTSPTIWAKG